MKVIMNSDSLISLKFAGGVLSDEIVELCGICIERNIAIVIPETAMFEFDRHHSDIAEKTAGALRAASALLNRFGIKHDEFVPEETVSKPDIVAQLESTGVKVETIEHGLATYKEALRRASYHLPPSSTRGKQDSDEMRDLVIWITALAEAAAVGGGILIARDHLFHDPRVDDEANQVGLRRFASIEDAIAHLRGLRPAAEALAAELMLALRGDLIDRGIAIAEDPSLYTVLEPRFVMGSDSKLARVSFGFETAQDGELQFEAKVSLTLMENVIAHVSLTEVKSDTLILPANALSFDSHSNLDASMIAGKAGLGDLVSFGGLGGPSV